MIQSKTCSSLHMGGWEIFRLTQNCSQNTEHKEHKTVHTGRYCWSEKCLCTCTKLNMTLKVHWHFLMAPAGRTCRRWLGLAEVMKVGPRMVCDRERQVPSLLSGQVKPCCHTGRTCLDVAFSLSTLPPYAPILLSVLRGCSCPLQNQNIALAWACLSVLCHHLQLSSLRFPLPRCGCCHFP